MRCFSLRQGFASYWNLLDEQQMVQVEHRLDQATREIALETDPSELQHWLDMVDLLEQALQHLEHLYQHRAMEQEAVADERDMMNMMRNVAI